MSSAYKETRYSSDFIHIPCNFGDDLRSCARGSMVMVRANNRESGQPCLVINEGSRNFTIYTKSG